MKNLIIGRMDHICTRKDQENSEMKKENFIPKSIIFNQDEGN